MRTEEELFADLPIRHTVPGETQNLDLALAQADTGSARYTRSRDTDIVSPLRESRENFTGVAGAHAT
jgi:hypothetical protein